MSKDSAGRLRSYGIEISPPDWKISKVKYIGSYLNGYPFKPHDWSDSGLPIIRIQDLTKSDTSPNYYDGEAPERYRLVNGDILIAWSASLGVFVWNRGEAWLNQHIFKVHIYEAEVTRQYYPWLADWFIGQLKNYAHGSTMQHLTADAFGSFPVLLPPLPKQKAISKFLSSETSGIDVLIAAKQALLGLLAEKRRTLVAEAVMRGLDRSAPLRPSSVDWLGDIPAHWEVRRLATLFSEKDERNEPDLPLLEVSINTGVSVRQFSSTQIEGTAADFNSYKVARKGSIAFNKMRMWQGAVGVTPTDGLISPDYVVAEPSPEIDASFAGLLFRTEAFSAECARNSQGITWDRLRLYWDGFRDISIGLPPFDEQRQIAEQVEAEASKIDKLATATERSIGLLKERRGALIAAAVTGQIAFPEAA